MSLPEHVPPRAAEDCATMTAVNASTHPVPIACPHCGCDHAELFPTLGDRSDYRCPSCLSFSISGTTEQLFENGTHDPKAARIITGEDGRRWLKP
jgi:hypothetical protein